MHLLVSDPSQTSVATLRPPLGVRADRRGTEQDLENDTERQFRDLPRADAWPACGYTSRRAMKTEARIILLAIALGLLSWMAEAVSDYYAFRGGQGSLQEPLIGASREELYVRAGVMVVFIGLGLMAALALRRRRRAEEALRASEALFRQFIEHTPAAVAMFDRDLRYLLYSKRWMTDYGLGDRDITGLSHYEVFPDIPERWKQIHQRVLAGTPEQCEEDPFERADGSVVWVRWDVRPWLDQAGEIGGIIMFTEVITERKRTELALKESEEKYRNLIETTDTGYLIVDTEGRVIDANAEYVRLTGYENLDQIRGRSVLEWTAPYDRDRNAEEVRKCLERGLVRDLEIDYIAPDGRTTPIEVDATVLDIHEGRVILALCRDITERRLAAEERRAFEKRIEDQKRRFYRETILSVTDGKLDVCDPEQIEPYIANSHLVMDLGHASQLAHARHSVEGFVRDAGLHDEQIGPLILGVGEATTNAIKHADQACVYAGAGQGRVWIAVSDKGTGIDSLILPRAVLLRGFSTKPSLGLGYTVILDVSDHVLLTTGEQGTTVVLMKNLPGPEALAPPLQFTTALPAR